MPTRLGLLSLPIGRSTVAGGVTGSGNHQANSATSSGLGDRGVVGSGNHQANSATSSGLGDRGVVGSGNHQAAPATSSGLGQNVKLTNSPALFNITITTNMSFGVAV